MIYHGDCLEVLKRIPDCSVDAVVTDPPYGLSFMGKKWDYDVPSIEVWRECLRVLKPGGHLLAFAGTRTQHRMAVRIEDAGFEIRDLVMWHYGQGFPKSKNLGNGFGSALKPATEPITLARKPLDGTLEANFAKHGTGALNIDATRVGNDERPLITSNRRLENNTYGSGLGGSQCNGETTQGRWPANLIHDGSEEVMGLLADASRFFYAPKASKSDRDEGLEKMQEVVAPDFDQRPSGDFSKRMNRDRPPVMKRNTHPTVKPTDLMRYLCRLVTPPGGTVLDPFMGSGSTGKAAILEGFSFIGIEREAEYVEIAKARIAAVQVQPKQEDLF